MEQQITSLKMSKKMAEEILMSLIRTNQAYVYLGRKLVTRQDCYNRLKTDETVKKGEMK